MNYPLATIAYQDANFRCWI